MSYKYLVGVSAYFHGMVCKPSRLVEVDEKTFYGRIAESLKKHDFMRHEKTANSKSALLKGITIGSEFFIIEKIKK